MVTLKMLANACNVSIATVSKALNGAPDIGAETAARIQKTAREMGYVPSAAARYLKTSRSHCFGVILDDGTGSGLSHEFFANILESFKRQAESLGYDIVLISDQPGPWGNDYLTHVKYRNCDGVLILACDDVVTVAQDITQNGIPVIVVDYSVDNCSAIKSDNVQGMRDLVQYAYSRGHRKIAAIFGEDCTVTRRRIASFYSTCERLGLEIPNEYVQSGIFHDTDSAVLATQRLLALKNRPTCILYQDDYSMVGAINEIEKHGLSVPEDVSITGYDGSLVARSMRPRITTIQQDTQKMGIAAANELVRAVVEERRFIPQEITIPSILLPGETVRRI